MRNPSRRPHIISKRVAMLQTFGLSSSKASVLANRRTNDIKRIEDCVHGVIDSLLLFDISLFYETEGLKIINYIVRMILTIGPYNIGLVVEYWKSFNDFLYNRIAGFNPVLPRPNRKNFFVRLLSWSKVQRIIDQDIDKHLLEAFAHLSSTRQMPVGDRRAEEKSYKNFISAIEAPYEISAELLNKVDLVTRSLGMKCLTFGKNITYPHISLSCAGSYYETVKDGGRGKEIRDSLKSYLVVRPVTDESIQTPFGDMHCPMGEPRWRYWCRDSPYQHYPDVDFGEVITEEVFAEQNLYYQGFDEAIGKQIMVVSYLEYQDWSLTGLPIPCRVLTVPEPGYKARIVTTGPYWLNTLQQGLSHSLKDILKNHPSVRSSLQKTDQAWQSLYLMSGKTYKASFSMLSSDLKEATDHIPKIIGVQLLRSFIRGIGLRSNLTEVALSLVSSDRTFICQNGLVSEKQTRGIMMGEPLTKVVLTLLNLFVEDLAMRDFLKVSPGGDYKSPPWRTFHVGGDDHLAVGPIKYLNRISKNHTLCGSKLSPGKHGTSNIVVKYTEKIIDVRNIYGSWNVRTINDSTESYEKSPFVDSIKVRLLSPLAKSIEVSSDRNVAIGKGLSMGRTLKWLNKDHFPTKWVRMVRDRFFQRMGSLLPDRTSGVYWHLMLPSFWGGLDLYLPDEVEEIFRKLPELTLSVMEDYIRNTEGYAKDVSLMGKLLSNYSYRGFRLNETEVSLMQSHIEIVIKTLPTSSWWDLKQEFDPSGVESAKSLSDIIFSEGWYDEHSVTDKLMRPILFKELLLGTEKQSVYNTERLKQRYAKLWDILYRGTPQLVIEEFRTCLKAKPKGLFYKVGYPEEIHFVSDRGYIYKSALDDALHGMPVLSIGYPYA